MKIAIPGGDALFQGMPGRLKVLYIATPNRDGAWLAEAFAADSAAEILLEEAAGQADGMERLRDEVFDAILVSHEPGELDALDLVEGYRTGGAEEPIVVLGTPSESEMAVLCYEVGADGYVCVADQHHAEPDLGRGAGRPTPSPGCTRTAASTRPSKRVCNASRTKPGDSCKNSGPRSRSSVPGRCGRTGTRR